MYSYCKQIKFSFYLTIKKTLLSSVFQISCFDWDSDGSHDFIGSFTTNLREMSSIQPPREVIQNWYLSVILRAIFIPM